MDNERKEPVNLGKSGSTDPLQSSQPYGQDPYNRPAFSNSDTVIPGPLKHSGLGIASFVLAMISVVLVIVTIVAGSSFVSSVVDNPEFLQQWEQVNPEDQEAVMALVEESGFVSIIVAVLAGIAACGIAFIGLILGIIGVFSRNRRKLFSVLGLVLNAIFVVAPIAFIMIGVIANISAAS